MREKPDTDTPTLQDTGKPKYRYFHIGSSTLKTRESLDIGEYHNQLHALVTLHLCSETAQTSNSYGPPLYRTFFISKSVCCKTSREAVALLTDGVLTKDMQCFTS